jgi:hypothetical protein
MWSSLIQRICPSLCVNCRYPRFSHLWCIHLQDNIFDVSREPQERWLISLIIRWSLVRVPPAHQNSRSRVLPPHRHRMGRNRHGMCCLRSRPENCDGGGLRGLLAKGPRVPALLKRTHGREPSMQKDLGPAGSVDQVFAAWSEATERCAASANANSSVSPEGRSRCGLSCRRDW